MTLRELLRAQQDPNDPPTITKQTFAGFKVSVEFPKGSLRHFKNDDGETCYKKLMQYPYGFLDNTQGRDGDEIDCILGPQEDCKEVFVAHMVDKGPDVSEREDEDKVMLGFRSYADALKAFYATYPHNFFGGMTTLPIATFKQRLQQTKSSTDKMLHAANQSAWSQ